MHAPRERQGKPVLVQRRTVLRQHGEMVRQVQVLLQILQRQIKLAGKDPLAEQEVQQQQAEVLASVTTPEQRPGERSSGCCLAPRSPPGWLALSALHTVSLAPKLSPDFTALTNDAQHGEPCGLTLAQYM